jgi:uncharacterized protein YuzE
VKKQPVLRLRYDREADVFVMKFGNRRAKAGVNVAEGVGVLVDAHGRIAEIEIREASRRLASPVLRSAARESIRAAA